MNAQLENLSLKREHDEDSNKQNKRKKPEVPEEVDATTNLIDDCLVYIFKLLKLRDLINVADTCKRFQASAQLAFVEKYRGKEIRLVPSSKNQMQPIKLIENTVVKIFALTSCFKVLRHFGVKIQNLGIHYMYLSENKKAALAWYMNEYCADTLVDFKVSYVTNEMTTNWTKTFSNVESIELSLSDLGDLSAWFPNVRRFVSYFSSQCIRSTLPHLEELVINIDTCGCDRASVSEMLRLNQQLKRLCLYGNDCDIKFMESVSEYLQSVRVLSMECNEEIFNSNGDSIHLKNVNEFDIKLSCFDSFPEIPFKFDQLETFGLTIDEPQCLNDNFENFISENPSLKEMKIYLEETTDSENTRTIEQIKTDMAKLSPSLEVNIIALTDYDVSEGEEGEDEEDVEDNI